MSSFPIRISQAGVRFPRVIIVPGNGCSPVHNANWYSWMENELIQSGRFSEVLLKDMPDPDNARERVWIPFIRDELKADENTILIGHSSGAVAAMRYLETNKLFGCVLVSACYTDLGIESERISGYYSRPWLWDSIKENSKWITQYHSTDDPFIPRAEADHVAANTGSEYTCFTGRSHFFSSRDVRHILPDILRHIEEELPEPAAPCTEGVVTKLTSDIDGIHSES